MAETKTKKEKAKEPKICPILMAGVLAKIGGYLAKTGSRGDTLCLGDKCEWFDNGCPAHPRLEFESGFQPGRIYASD
jgi:hypothetical protein